MASIQDVADQINAKLDSITTNTALTAANTTQTLVVTEQIRNRLDAIEAVLAAGFANLSQGLFAQLEQQRATNALLEHHRRQNDTVICELVNANDLLCGITRKLTAELALGEALVGSSRRIEGVAVRVHAGAAGEYDRELAIRTSIAECCPPPPDEPEPCPVTCDKPRFRAPKPEGQGWEPLPVPDRPIG